ncbi:MAG: family 16 glycosylhydrolase [Spirochaetales bacterium]|nr:family 16 glycosylhydrolase [Spirochaetales bacterium]
MKGYIFFIIGILCIFLFSCISTQHKEIDGIWTLIWEDEFKGNKIDSSKWTFDRGNGFMSKNEWISGWGNDELEYYTDRPENAYVRNNLLTIRAIKETYKGKAGEQEQTFHYTSARLKTKELFSKLYGRFEFRARLPEGKGLWSALWLMPDNDQYGTWAASGEIDILETKGSIPTEVSSAIHFGAEWPGNKSSGEKYTFPKEERISSFHIYTLEWEPGELRWYVDGNLYSTLNRWYTRRGTYPAPFNRKFHILMNLAVGGHFDGNPDETTPFPAQMQIDYVRVYELTGRPYRFPEKPPEEIPPEPRPREARPVLEDGNEVYNNSYTLDDPGVKDNAGIPGTAYWIFLHLPEFGGDGALSLEELSGTRFARIDVTKTGNQPYSLQLIQRVPLIKGHRYKASFIAKAKGNRGIQVKINGDEDNSWVTYSNVETINLTDMLTTYEFTFGMEYKTDVEARFEFNVGLDYTSVWIGNVRLDDITGE